MNAAPHAHQAARHLAAGLGQPVRTRLANALHRFAERGQLGPTRELEWRSFQPRH